MFKTPAALSFNGVRICINAILIKRKSIIIGFIGFDLPTAGRDPCNLCNTMIAFLGDDFLYMLKLMTLGLGEAKPRPVYYCRLCLLKPGFKKANRNLTLKKQAEPAEIYSALEF